MALKILIGVLGVPVPAFMFREHTALTGVIPPMELTEVLCPRGSVVDFRGVTALRTILRIMVIHHMEGIMPPVEVMAITEVAIIPEIITAIMVTGITVEEDTSPGNRVAIVHGIIMAIRKMEVVTVPVIMHQTQKEGIAHAIIILTRKVVISLVAVTSPVVVISLVAGINPTVVIIIIMVAIRLGEVITTGAAMVIIITIGVVMAITVEDRAITVAAIISIRKVMIRMQNTVRRSRLSIRKKM